MLNPHRKCPRTPWDVFFLRSDRCHTTMNFMETNPTPVRLRRNGEWNQERVSAMGVESLLSPPRVLVNQRSVLIVEKLVHLVIRNLIGIFERWTTTFPITPINLRHVRRT